MVQLIGYHVTTEDRFDSIMDKGLIPCHPTRDGNYQDGYSFLDDQPTAVYFECEGPAPWWALDRAIFIKFDFTGIKFDNDPEDRCGDWKYVTETIDLDRFLDVDFC